jgi:outer membrane protein TolC
MNNTTTYIFSFLLASLFSLSIQAQDENEPVLREYNLDQIIEMVQSQSPFALRAETRKENRYWNYRTYIAQYRPQVFLSGELPSYLRTNDAVRQPDGSYEFRTVNQNLTQLELGIRQPIGLTGGSVYVQSELQRFDNFENDVTSYSGNPAVIGFFQPLFNFNFLKWDREIEPLRYEESLKDYAETLEQIAVTATRFYFDVLLAQVNLELAERNQANNDTIYQITKGRYNLGKIGEDELLRIEYNLMLSRQEVAQAQLDLESNTLRLRSYVGIKDDEAFTLLLPNEIPEIDINENVAIAEALKNNPSGVEFERRIKEAEREVAQAKGNTGLNATLSAQYGLTNRGDAFPDLYINPENQQRLSIDFDFPILDWGRRKAQVKQAQANYELEQNTVTQDRINFEQEVFTLVRTFKMQRNQVEISLVANDIAARKYEISKQRYLIGKTSITDLIIQLQEKDRARRDYIRALDDFWNNYYDLRRATLYDFAEDKSLLTPEVMQGYE